MAAERRYQAMKESVSVVHILWSGGGGGLRSRLMMLMMLRDWQVDEAEVDVWKSM